MIISPCQVTWSGPSPPRALSCSLAEVTTRHLDAGGRVANTPSSPSTTTASAEYLLCEGGGGTVTVGAAWTRVAQLLEVPPLDSTITLDIQVVTKFLC